MIKSLLVVDDLRVTMNYDWFVVTFLSAKVHIVYGLKWTPESLPISTGAPDAAPTGTKYSKTENISRGQLGK